jgi:predicted Fe-Mo cluster-binding NifX family protein
MKVCIPTQEDKGAESLAYGHFGSAPCFIIIDSETGEIRSVANNNQHHAHGACHPMSALGGMAVDAVVVGGIGRRAVMGLNEQGIKVYQAIAGTALENVNALKSGNMIELTVESACGGHAHGAECGH